MSGEQIFRNTLSNRVALVTGAGAGIGRATARLLAFAGARVGLVGGPADDALERTHEEILRAHGASMMVRADLTSAEAMKRAVDAVDDRWGGLDIVVASGGIQGVWAALEDIPPDEWARTMAVNLHGTFLTAKASVPLLKRRGGGAMVIVSSTNGTRVFSHTGATAFSASKAGQLAIGRMLALELAPFHIRVNTVCPGEMADVDGDGIAGDSSSVYGVNSKGHSALRHGCPGAPEQVAQLIWFLTSDAAGHITGTEVYIDAGESLVGG